MPVSLGATIVPSGTASCNLLSASRPRRRRRAGTGSRRCRWRTAAVSCARRRPAVRRSRPGRRPPAGTVDGRVEPFARRCRAQAATTLAGRLGELRLAHRRHVTVSGSSPPKIAKTTPTAAAAATSQTAAYTITARRGEPAPRRRDLEGKRRIDADHRRSAALRGFRSHGDAPSRDKRTSRWSTADRFSRRRALRARSARDPLRPGCRTGAARRGRSARRRGVCAPRRRSTLAATQPDEQAGERGDERLRQPVDVRAGEAEQPQHEADDAADHGRQAAS